MNWIHQRICGSAKWAGMVRAQLLPWALDDVRLGDNVLEIGPGFGATTRVLVDSVGQLTVLEVDRASADRLRAEFAGTATVVHGDGARIPLPDNEFSGVCCFTMLHHVPSHAEQDALFAEACRVLEPGGVFAGSDSQPSLRFRLLHIGDTMTVVDPDTLPDRLRAAGFTDARVDSGSGRIRFLAHKR